MKSSAWSVNALAAFALAVLVSSCSKQDDKALRERGRIEGIAQADAQLSSDREAARLMEADLAARWDFYEANSGHYEGTSTDGDSKYRIKISLFPNAEVNRYRGTRSRSQEEVQTDLNALTMNVHITQRDPNVEGSSVPCKVEGLRPDITTGVLNIIKEACGGSYFLVLNRTSISGTAHMSSSRVLNIQAERL